MPQVRVGPQQLEGVGAARDRGRRRRLVRQRVGADVVPAEPVAQPVHRVAAERRRVQPALAEHRLDVVHAGARDGGLHVVPGRRRPVDRRHRTAAAGRRGARRRRGGSGTGRCRRRRRRRARGSRGTGSPRSFWWCEPPVRTRMSSSASAPLCLQPTRPAAGSRRRRRTARPSASARSARGRRRPAGRRVASSARHLAARLAGQPLVGVAAPVGEVDEVAGAGWPRSARPARRSRWRRAPAAGRRCPATTPSRRGGRRRARCAGCRAPPGSAASPRDRAPPLRRRPHAVTLGARPGRPQRRPHPGAAVTRGPGGPP